MQIRTLSSSRLCHVLSDCCRTWLDCD